MTTDPTATLRAVAAFYRNEDFDWPASRDPWGDRHVRAALADLFDGIAERHHAGPEFQDECGFCGHMEPWPCTETLEALAVAAALGIEA
jgi:hypothetical protein